MSFKINNDEPLFPISKAAELLNVSIPTLRMYEREGLIIPFKKSTSHRLFSKNDLERIECIRRAINESKISINGIKMIYSLIPCWNIVGCSLESRKKCTSFGDNHEPCWTIKHPGTECENKNCRECPVYKDFSECGRIKESIKNLGEK
ncbi:MAG: MerR family transcriptional regulator [Syntrophomonadaceae bacterium]